MLAFTLPTKRASQRVEVWRKLQRYGAVPLGNSGYLLPNSPSNRERFEWLAQMIRKHAGEASVVSVQSIDNLSIDPVQSTVGGGLTTTSPRTPVDGRNYDNERARSDFDQLHVLQLSAIGGQPSTRHRKGTSMRIQGRLRLGFFPLPLTEARRIRACLRYPASPFSAIDPCIGDGAAFLTITGESGARRYGIELDAYRAEQATAVVDEIIHGDCLDVHCPVESCGLAFLNPPYDWTAGEARSEAGRRNGRPLQTEGQARGTAGRVF